jgi:hypothetical protein
MTALLDKPSLLFVIGVPVGFMTVSLVIAWLIFWGVGRVQRH